MNKFLLCIPLFFILSCSKVEIAERGEKNIEFDTNFVSEQEAIDALSEYLSEFESPTKGFSGRTISNIYSSGGFGMTKASSEDFEEPLVYVINFDENNGFAIVSGDRRIQPILAITDHGNLPQGSIVSNPGMIAMLSRIDTDYRMSVGLPVEGEDGELYYPLYECSDGSFVYPCEDDTEREDIIDPDDRGDGGGSSSAYTYTYTPWTTYADRGTLVGCEWGQSSTPYNLYTYTADGQKAPAGCVATAVAQIMYYWGHDFIMDGYSFDWSLMHQHTGPVSYPSAYSMIGELFLKLGRPYNLDMNYGVNGSGAADANVARTFVNCGFTSGGSMVDYDYNSLYNIISARPVYVSGYSKKVVTEKKLLGITTKTTTTYKNGHAWVIDQVRTRSRVKTTYENGVWKNEATEYDHLVHCNFGWSGADNGYYYSSRFDTNVGPVTRATVTEYGTDYYYQYYLHMNIGIEL